MSQSNVRLVATGTRTQSEFVHSPDKFPAFVGGYGSGKTYALCLRAMRLLIEDRVNIGYYMPTYDLIRHVGFPRLREMIENSGLPIRSNIAAATIEVPGYGTIIFRTMDNPDRLVGYEVGHSLVDELDTLPKDKAEDVWQKALARNRIRLTNSTNTIAVGTTPEGFRFVYERWGRDIDKAEAAGYRLYKGKTSENTHLPQDYLDNLRNQYPSQLLEAYINGEFVNLSDGIIHREWFRPSTLVPAHLSMGVDLATSLKTSADSSAIVIGGLVDGVFHVVHAAAKKGTFHEVQQWIKEVAAIWKPTIISIEAVQYQLAAVQELMRTSTLPVVAVRPDKDKASRLLPLASRYEQGMVRHAPANGGNDIKRLEDELVSFPNGAHDDLVDALVYAWSGAPRTASTQPLLGKRREVF